MEILVSVTERTEGSESGDGSGGTCICRETCFQKGESSTWKNSLGIFITILYHIAWYYVMGEGLLEWLVLLACLLKL